MAAHTTTEWNCGSPRGYPVNLFFCPSRPLTPASPNFWAKAARVLLGTLLGAYERGVGLENLAGAETQAARRFSQATRAHTPGVL